MNIKLALEHLFFLSTISFFILSLLYVLAINNGSSSLFGPFVFLNLLAIALATIIYYDSFFTGEPAKEEEPASLPVKSLPPKKLYYNELMKRKRTKGSYYDA